MKSFTKKLLSVLSALILSLSLGFPILAATNGSITINNGKLGHTYQIYQVFTGEVKEDGTGDAKKEILSSLKWGYSVKSQNQPNTWVPDSIINDINDKNSSESDVNGAIVANKGLSDYVVGLIDKDKPFRTFTPTTDNQSQTFDNIDTGYYLIMDTDKKGSGNSSILSSNVIEVVGSVDITLKTTNTTPEKKIKDGDNLVDINDYNIGDTITYQLKATLGSGLSAYNSYKLIFTDTLSSGLEFIKITDVTIDGKDPVTGSYETNIQDNGKLPTYTSNKENDKYKGGTQLIVTFDNLFVAANATTGTQKAALSQKDVIITYTAKLTKAAVIGNAGNPNELTLTFSRDPNNSNETTTTPPDEVVVFTFELDGTKVDGNDKTTPLKDAVFALRKKDVDNWKYAKFEEANGKYKVTEWITNNIPESEKNISQEDITNLLTGANALPNKAKVSTDGEGKFNFSGLDTGNYQLIELVAPSGYNLLTAPVNVTISAKVNENNMPVEKDDTKTYAVTELTGTVNNIPATPNLSNGTLDFSVENNQGTTLPETGGMGTTMIYLIGGGLVLLSAVLLVTRKRVNG